MRNLKHVLSLFALCFLAVQLSACSAPRSADEDGNTLEGVLNYDPLMTKSLSAWHGWNFRVNGHPVLPSHDVPESLLMKYVGRRVLVTGEQYEGVEWNPASPEAGPAETTKRGWGLRLTSIEVVR